MRISRPLLATGTATALLTGLAVVQAPALAVSRASEGSTSRAAGDITCATRITTTGGYTVGGSVSVNPPHYSQNGHPYSTTDITYRWFRMGSADPTTNLTQLQESRSPVYTPTEADFGHQLEASVSTPGQGGQYGGGSLPKCFSGGTPFVGGRPAVTGRPRVGRTVAADAGSPPAGITAASYQWFYVKVVKTKHHHNRLVRVKIHGAKHARYHVRKRDRGHLLAVAVTYAWPSLTPAVVLSRPKRVR